MAQHGVFQRASSTHEIVPKGTQLNEASFVSAPFVVVTSISPPTAAVRCFAERSPGRLIVVGDRKTPAGWTLAQTEYLAPDAQVARGGALAGLLPWNHYCRKMLGYLRAAERGAEVIFDTDDDNFPTPDWQIPAFAGIFATTREGLGFVNIYRAFSDAHIWPRGFPLRSILDPKVVLARESITTAPATVGIWQMLADGDPDVDAIYRLVDNRRQFFQDREPLVLGAGTLCPFNSQATAFRQPLFPLLYLPTSVTFRFTDILRGLVAQPILWAAGYSLGFTKAMVVQERNPHDFLKDFESELPGYLHAERVPEIVAAVIRREASVAENLVAAYAALQRAGIVGAEEPRILAAWLEDLAAAARVGAP
jgi:hypothetical protein